MIAIPITSGTVEDALKDIKLAEKSGADYIELRLDYISKLDENSLRTIINAISVSTIVTIRRKAERGNFTGTEKERIDLLLTACKMGANYVDIEHDTDIDFSTFQNTDTKVICSYHNFKQTPPVENLLSIIKSCILKKPDVVKIITMAKKYSDNIVILDFLEKIKKDIKIISFCMGDKGKLSRVLCTKFGSFLTFAALEDKKKSAPGQVDISIMKEFSEVLI